MFLLLERSYFQSFMVINNRWGTALCPRRRRRAPTVGDQRADRLRRCVDREPGVTVTYYM